MMLCDTPYSTQGEKDQSLKLSQLIKDSLETVAVLKEDASLLLL
jgi:hypothetical protein